MKRPRPAAVSAPSDSVAECDKGEVMESSAAGRGCGGVPTFPFLGWGGVSVTLEISLD